MMAARPQPGPAQAADRLAHARRILDARLAKGMSQAELARAARVSQQTIINIERGTVRSRNLARVAHALGLNPAEFGAVMPAELPYAMVADVMLRAATIPLANFPVHFTAEAGAAELTVDASVGDYIRRPGPLAQAAAGYGVYVAGTAMVPEFRPGEIALVNPDLPVTPAASYVFYAEHPGSGRATLKWLRRATDDHWLVTQHNPPAGKSKDVSLRRKDWPVAHRVIGKYARR
jgi:transcriptional regulator with XRE-family HTH domain